MNADAIKRIGEFLDERAEVVEEIVARHADADPLLLVWINPLYADEHEDRRHALWLSVGFKPDDYERKKSRPTDPGSGLLLELSATNVAKWTRLMKEIQEAVPDFDGPYLGDFVDGVMWLIFPLADACVERIAQEVEEAAGNGV